MHHRPLSAPGLGFRSTEDRVRRNHMGRSSGCPKQLNLSALVMFFRDAAVLHGSVMVAAIDIRILLALPWAHRTCTATLFAFHIDRRQGDGNVTDRPGADYLALNLVECGADGRYGLLCRCCENLRRCRLSALTVCETE